MEGQIVVQNMTGSNGFCISMTNCDLYVRSDKIVCMYACVRVYKALGARLFINPVIREGFKEESFETGKTGKLLVNPVNQFVTQVSIFAVGTRSSEPTGPRDILISEPTSLAGIS